MRLDEIHSMWAEDSVVDDVDLDRESGKTPKLHSKYLRILSEERMILHTLNEEMNELKAAKTDRLLGVMSKEELDRRGWEPERRRIMKPDVNDHLMSDPDVVKLRLRVALQKEKCDSLDSILRMIMNRNYVMKSMIDWRKFVAGVG